MSSVCHFRWFKSSLPVNAGSCKWNKSREGIEGETFIMSFYRDFSVSTHCPHVHSLTTRLQVVIPWLPVRSIVGWPLWRVMGWAKGIPKGWPTFSEREWPTLTPNGWLGQTPGIENIGAPAGIIRGWARRGAWAVPKGWVTFAERWSGTFTVWPKGTPNAIGWTPGIWKVGAPAARLSKAVSQHSRLLLVSHQ